MYEVFEKLLALHKTTAAKVASATGIAPSTFSDWKNGRYTPKADKLQKIADYFNVPVSLIMYGPISKGIETLYLGGAEAETAEPAPLILSPQLARLRELLEGLNEEGINKIIEYAEDITAVGKYKKCDSDMAEPAAG